MSFDIHGMMQSVLSLIQERVKEHSIDVSFSCDEKIGNMNGDETRIKQTMFNLVSNAIKYSEPGQTITIGAKEEEKDKIVLWVEDQGQGIDPDEQGAVFEKFYKGKNARAR